MSWIDRKRGTLGTAESGESVESGKQAISIRTFAVRARCLLAAEFSGHCLMQLLRQGERCGQREIFSAYPLMKMSDNEAGRRKLRRSAKPTTRPQPRSVVHRLHLPRDAADGIWKHMCTSATSDEKCKYLSNSRGTFSACSADNRLRCWMSEVSPVVVPLRENQGGSDYT